MSGKLDQSLDQIMQDGGSKGARRNARPRTNRRAAQKAKAAIAAPTGGVSKSTRAPRAPAMPAMAAPRRPANTGESKIIINGLPLDVPEKDLKDYISKTVAPPKRVMITYGPDGRSRGIATVIFADATSSTRAAKLLDNIKIDGRTIKVEHVLSDTAAIPAPKTLADRMSKPKNAAKESTKAAPKGKAAATPATNGAAKKEAGGKGKKSGRAGRPKKKTADELDAEMMDYFGNEGGAAATNGAAAPAAPAAATNGAVAEPVDEVM